jgi:hypothetical protein
METLKMNPRAILKLWQFIEPQIQKALDISQGESDTFDVFTWLMNPDYAQCWIVFDEDKQPLNVTVTRINTYGQHRSLCIVTTTCINEGDVNTFNSEDKTQEPYRIMHEKLYEFAKEKKLKRIELYGRPGWKRLLKQVQGLKEENYKNVYTVMSMDIKY